MQVWALHYVRCYLPATGNQPQLTTIRATCLAVALVWLGRPTIGQWLCLIAFCSLIGRGLHLEEIFALAAILDLVNFALRQP